MKLTPREPIAEMVEAIPNWARGAFGTKSWVYIWRAMHDAAPTVEAQPVAWMDDFGNAFPLAANKGAGSWLDEHKRNWKPLYTHPAAPQPAALPEKLIRFTLRDLKAKREALSGFVAIGNELERAREYDQWIQALELYIAQAALKGKQ